MALNPNKTPRKKKYDRILGRVSANPICGQPSWGFMATDGVPSTSASMHIFEKRMAHLLKTPHAITLADSTARFLLTDETFPLDVKGTRIALIQRAVEAEDFSQVKHFL